MIEVVASQLPLIPEYTEALRTQWQFSRHPENLRDTIDAIKAEDVTNAQKAGAAACLGFVGWALGPGNEMTLGYTIGTVLEKTDSVVAAVATAPATTGPLELSAGLGMAYLMNKFSKATGILRKRYVGVDENIPEGAKSPGRAKRLAQTLGIVSMTGTGASGATLYHGLHDSSPEGRNKRSKMTAVSAAGMLAVINAGYAAAILAATKGAEAVGATSVTEKVAGFISNPLLVGVLMGGAVATKRQYDILKYNHGNSAKKDTPKPILQQEVIADTTVASEIPEVVR